MKKQIIYPLIIIILGCSSKRWNSAIDEHYNSNIEKTIVKLNYERLFMPELDIVSEKKNVFGLAKEYLKILYQDKNYDFEQYMDIDAVLVANDKVWKVIMRKEITFKDKTIFTGSKQRIIQFTVFVRKLDGALLAQTSDLKI